MHLLHVIHRYPPALGGSEAYAERLGKYHAANGDTVTVYTSTADDLAAMRERGHREFPPGVEQGNPAVHRFAPLRFPGRRYVAKALSLVGSDEHRGKWLPCNPLLFDLWKTDGPAQLDAVHALALPYANPLYAALRIARRRRVPFLLTPFLHWGDPNNPQDETRKQYTQRPLVTLMKQADMLFAQTNMEAMQLEKLGVPSSRIVLQGLGVEPSECTGGDRAAYRTALGIPQDAVVIGHLTNLSVAKGTLDLLEAFERSPENSVLLLAGNQEPSLPKIEPQPRVIVRGRLSDKERRDFFAACDIFALPSRTDSFGLVLLEAWANSLPNIVYRAGGPGELVLNKVDGFTVPCGNVDELYKALNILIEDAEVRVNLGESGQARLAYDFAWPAKLKIVRDTIAAMLHGV